MTEFKVGETVRGLKTNTRFEVLAVDEETASLWVRYTRGDRQPFTKDYQQVRKTPTWFEEGKTYSSTRSFTPNTETTFTVDSVKQDEEGRGVAFGLLTIPSLLTIHGNGAAKSRTIWAIKREGICNFADWEEV